MTEPEYIGPFFVCAGEPSGDLYASLLIESLKAKVQREKLKVERQKSKGKSLKSNLQSLPLYGVGGDEMRTSGVKILEHYNSLSAFGFGSGISSVASQYQVYRKIARLLYRIRPKTFIAIAYPGINLLLCRYAKKQGCNVYYYMPPQIWAWGEFRTYFIKKWVDRVISVFPFEYDFCRNKGIAVEYFENPLIERLRVYERQDFIKRIGFMPGSRTGEIRRNLPVVIELMKKIEQMNPGIVFSLIVHSQMLITDGTWITMELESLKKSYGHNLEVVTDSRHQAMKNCDLLVLCSGTASLEAAFMRIPQIFFNRPSWFDYYIMKWFLRTDEYNLANHYYARRIVPVFIARRRSTLVHRLYTLIQEFLID